MSGQNVGFVLVLVSPLTARLGWRGRWTATVAVILAFGIITRFEPSVLRASAMAAVAVTAGAVGRPSGSVRTLAVAVTGVILIDPLLVRSVSFQLSVGASLAIALFAARIATIIPGPRGFADALGVTMAAQFGVAPVLVPLTGGLPVVSLVANPLAVPVAGLVTTWGLPAGAIAGLAGPVVAAVIHTPTDLMITWVALVARWSAGLPLGAVGWPHLALLGLAAAIASRVPSVRGIAAIVAFATLAAPAIALRSEPGVVDPAASISLYRSNGATVVVTNGLTRPLELLEVMRTRGVRRVDVLVIAGARGAEVDRVVRHRWKVGRTLDAATTGPTRLRVGDLVVTVVPSAAPAVVVRPP